MSVLRFFFYLVIRKWTVKLSLLVFQHCWYIQKLQWQLHIKGQHSSFSCFAYFSIHYLHFYKHCTVIHHNPYQQQKKHYKFQDSTAQTCFVYQEIFTQGVKSFNLLLRHVPEETDNHHKDQTNCLADQNRRFSTPLKNF